MKNILYLVIFLFLLTIPYGMAITSTATVDIENSPVRIELITARLRNNEVTVKAKVKDANGYQDIERVAVEVEYGDEIYLNQEARFDSGAGIEALYVLSFGMDEDDKEGVYTVKVKAEDKETSEERTTEYKFPEETGALTGAFIQVQDTGAGLLTRFFSWIKNLFS